MPICHFAFGSLYRKGRFEEQANEFINKILLPRSLMASKCPEFLPIINNPGAKWAVPGSAVQSDGGGVTFERWVQSPTVGLLPCDVWMISFCNIPLKKLHRWVPSKHYGQLGIAFSNNFKRRHTIRDVHYYTLRGLEKDNLVKQFNDAASRPDEKKRDKISNILLGYRKPAILWREFEELFGMVHIRSAGDGNTSLEHITYSRYETGYVFQDEREARWVTTENIPHLSFEENDVVKIIVPNLIVGDQIKDALEASWSKTPELMAYPSTR